MFESEGADTPATAHERYKVDVPEGVRGAWRVERFEVSQREADLDRLRAAINPHRAPRFVPAGRYTRLMRGGTVVMSDTPDEIRDHLPFIHRAEGRVLIHGLGLGMVARAVLRKPSVDHVTVVEASPDVIALVGPWLMDVARAAKSADALRISMGDAYTWKPAVGERWSAVWHDIWDTISVEHLPKMTTLHRRFGRRCDWQDSWGRNEALASQRRSPRYR